MEHSTQLPNVLTGNSDLGRNVYFKLQVELDRLSAPSELHLNDLVILGLNFRVGSLLRELCPTARNSRYHFAVLHDLEFGFAFLRSKQIVPGLNLGAADCRGFLDLP